MPGKIVLGAQWGDEGKGKYIDIFASQADVVVRSQGGNNAGHTVVVGDESYKLQLIPSGILYPDCVNIIGPGVVVNPKSILGEMDGLNARGISTDKLYIDARAHCILPWHLELDALSEKARGGDEGPRRSRRSCRPSAGSARRACCCGRERRPPAGPRPCRRR